MGAIGPLGVLRTGPAVVNPERLDLIVTQTVLPTRFEGTTKVDLVAPGIATLLEPSGPLYHWYVKVTELVGDHAPRDAVSVDPTSGVPKMVGVAVVNVPLAYETLTLFVTLVYPLFEPLMCTEIVRPA